MSNEREQVKTILHNAIYWGCRYEPCPNRNCEQCALDRIDALYESELKRASDLGDILRKWLVSTISDEELCKTFGISEYDCKILFQEKMANWNSYIGSLVNECDYPLCKVRQAISENNK